MPPVVECQRERTGCAVRSKRDGDPVRPVKLPLVMCEGAAWDQGPETLNDVLPLHPRSLLSTPPGGPLHRSHPTGVRRGALRQLERAYRRRVLRAGGRGGPLWPDQFLSERNIHSACTQKKQGIVWIGIKGTYALKEWGYEQPSMTLFESVCDIVRRKYKETSKPVFLEIINSELGKYRRIINPTSILFAAYCNPSLKRVGRSSFIPKQDDVDDKEGISLNELDRIFREFQEKQK